MNEHEARPCGGFVTAYGELRILPPKLKIKNIYDFPALDLGEAEYPLTLVSAEKKFWDLGTNIETAVCAENFKQVYIQAHDQVADNVFLVNWSALESLFLNVGKLNLNQQALTSDKLFTAISRTVANVDRHDEASLAQRKNPIKGLGKQVIIKALINPTLWPKISHSIGNSLAMGHIYWDKKSISLKPKLDDFSVIEWNLGGGKSSRLLEKKLQIIAREQAPQSWQLDLNFTAHHLGGWDEPLSQEWKGVLEFIIPTFLGPETKFIEAQIAPGEIFNQSFSFDYAGELTQLSIFKAREQSLIADITVALFPQQRLTSSELRTIDNVGRVTQNLTSQRQAFSWLAEKDQTPPFITLHEVVAADSLEKSVLTNLNWQAGDLLTEIHFSEAIKIMSEEFKAELEDRDFTVKDITEHPIFKNFRLLENQVTLIINWEVENYQIDERFYLRLTTIEDLWGNKLKEDKRTIITR